MRLQGFHGHSGPAWYWVVLSTALLTANSAYSQGASLSLASGSAAQGSSVALNLALNASGNLPGSLQWTISYPTSDIVSLSATAGSALTAAKKSLTCRSASGSIICVASGVSSNTIASGVVAVVAVTLSPTSRSSISLPVTSVMGAASDGTFLAVSGAGSVITSTASTAPVVSGLQCSPATVTSGSNTMCTVTLSKAAPSGGSAVTLSDNSSALTVPASVTVGAGATSASFTATSGTVTATQAVTVTAKLGTSTVTTAVTVAPAATLTLTGLQCSPATVTSGSNTMCTVTLSKAAPSGGSAVTLSDNSSALAMATSVTVAAGATSVNFAATSGTVTSNQAVTITAKLGASTVTTVVTVAPPSSPRVTGLQCSPATVTAGSNATCTVTLSNAAPSGGSAVTLSDNNAALTVPASVTVGSGATSASFTAASGTVTATQAVTITAKLGTSTVTAAVTVTPAATLTLTGLQCSPATVTAGSNTLCTVTLSKAAPSGGSVVTLSDNSSALAMATSVTVAAGATSVNFAATSGTVTSNQAVTITAKLGTSTVTTTVTIVPAGITVSGLQCSPASIASGGSSTCTVTLSKAATVTTESASAAGPSGVTAAYNFNEGSGTVAGDSSGNGRTGTLVNSPAWTTSGKYADGLVLNGSSNYVRVDSPNLPTGDFTWMLWVKRNNVSSFQTLLEAQGGDGAELEIDLDNGKVNVWSNGKSRFTSSGSIPANTWTHVALTRSGPTIKVYINGAADSASGSDSGTFNFSSCPLLIGVDADSGCTGLLNGYLNGTIDDVKVYNRALTQAEVQTSMNTAVSSPSPVGTQVTLSDNSSVLTVPASTTVAAGATTAKFTVQAGTVSTNQTVTITATLNSSTAKATLTITQASARALVSGLVEPNGLYCSPKVVNAGDRVTCEVRMNRGASASRIRLASSSSQVRVPSAVTTRSNQSFLSFQASVDVAATQQSVRFTAIVDEATVDDVVMVKSSAAPVLTVPDMQFAKFDAPIHFQVSGVDPSGLPVQLKASNLPSGASFDGSSGRFDWTPEASQAGKHQVTFTASNSSGQSTSAEVAIEAGSGAPVLSGAGACSPGAIGTLQGKWLVEDGKTVADASGESMALDGTVVKVNGQSVPALFVSPSRVNFVCPSLEAGTPLSLAVETPSAVSQPLTSTMQELSPQIFLLDGASQDQGAVSFVGTNDMAVERNAVVAGYPAQPGDEILIWGTGFGNAGGASDRQVTVKLGGLYAQVESVVAVPGKMGVYTIQARVPAAIIASDAAPLSVQITGADGRLVSSNTARITVEPVSQ